MRVVPFLAALAVAAASAPVHAIDWPVAGGPMLEVRTGGYVVAIPAPVWIGDAAYDEDRDGDVNVRARWRVLRGFDLVAQQAVVEIVDFETGSPGLIGYLSGHFFDNCNDRAEKMLELPTENPTLFLTYALCGYDYGTSSGGMIIGLTRMFGPDYLTLDAWYHVPLAPFSTANEAEWPMSAADLEATALALDAAVTIVPDPGR